MNFASQQFDAIKTSKYWLFDFPKIIDFTNKEISLKWCLNLETIEKTWLLQESIAHRTTSFEAFVNKKPTFNCCIIDVGTTIFFWNTETLERTWLLQESITHSTTIFCNICQEKSYFSLFHFDVSTTIFF